MLSHVICFDWIKSAMSKAITRKCYEIAYSKEENKNAQRQNSPEKTTTTTKCVFIDWRFTLLISSKVHFQLDPIKALASFTTKENSLLWNSHRNRLSVCLFSFSTFFPSKFALALSLSLYSPAKWQLKRFVYHNKILKAYIERWELFNAPTFSVCLFVITAPAADVSVIYLTIIENYVAAAQSEWSQSAKTSNKKKEIALREKKITSFLKPTVPLSLSASFWIAQHI